MLDTIRRWPLPLRLLLLLLGYSLVDGVIGGALGTRAPSRILQAAVSACFAGVCVLAYGRWNTKRIAGVETERQLAEVQSELRDRYGEPPLAVVQLIAYAGLRLEAVRAGVTSIERKRDLLTIKFLPDARIDPAKLASFVRSQPGAQFMPDGTLKFTTKGLSAQALLQQLQSLLQGLEEQKRAPSIA